jgi:hypothetical protein
MERLSRKETGNSGSIQIGNELEGGISDGVMGRTAMPVSGGGSAVGDMVAVSEVVGTNGCG